VARQDVLDQVTVQAGADEHADAPLDPRRVVTGVLEHMPGLFEQEALLRVHDLGLARGDAENPASKRSMSRRMALAGT